MIAATLPFRFFPIVSFYPFAKSSKCRHPERSEGPLYFAFPSNLEPCSPLVILDRAFCDPESLYLSFLSLFPIRPSSHWQSPASQTPVSRYPAAPSAPANHPSGSQSRLGCRRWSLLCRRPSACPASPATSSVCAGWAQSSAHTAAQTTPAAAAVASNFPSEPLLTLTSSGAPSKLRLGGRTLLNRHQCPGTGDQPSNLSF